MSMIRLATLVLLGAPGLAVFNEKECDAEFGNCLDISQCPESSRKHNLCPSQGRDVKCCIPYDVTDCLNIGGHCKRNDSACDGYWISSRCQQPANVQCCVARTSSSQTSKSPSLQPTAASSNNGCGRKKEMEALDFILRNGKCQNSSLDPGF